MRVQPSFTVLAALAAAIGLAAAPPASAQRIVDLAAGEQDVVVRGVVDGAEMIALHHGFAAADLTGDGVDHLVVGVAEGSPAPCPTAGAGAVHVFYGPRASGDDFDVTDADLTICGDDEDDWFGSFLEAGDVNDDGVIDLLVGARQAVSPTSGAIQAGELRVFHGPLPPAGTVLQAADADLSILGCGLSDNTGASAAVGDVDDDGIDDLVLGAINAAGPDDTRGVRTGEIYIFFGPVLGPVIDLCPDPEDDADVVIYGVAPWDAVGRDLALADLGGDATLDILFGAMQGAATATPGFAGVLFGRASWPAVIDLDATAPDVQFLGDDVGDRFGIAVEAGDLDDDGQADALVGTYRARGPGNSRGSAGEVHGFLGPLAAGTIIDLDADPDAADVRIFGAHGDGLGWDMVLGEGVGCGTMDLHVGALNRRVVTLHGPFPAGTEIDLVFDTPAIEIRAEAPGDFLGQAVAVGDLNDDGAQDVITVARRADHPVTGAENAGAAYAVFGHRCPADCNALEEVRPDDLVAHDRFGSALAAWGDLMVSGVRRTPADTGAVYVYRRTSGAWAQEAKVFPSDGQPQDVFGWRVDLSGETFVVGAPFADPNGPASGAAYVYTHDGTGWVEEAKLVPIGGEPGDQFGYDVAIDGDTVVVGAPSAAGSNPPPFGGIAYVFERSGGSWTQEAVLQAPDDPTGGSFGRAVAVSGSRLLVGAPSHEHGGGGPEGAGYVFRQQGNNWAFEAELLPVGAIESPAYGDFADIWGHTAVISSVGEDVGSSGFAGTVRVFHRTGNAWTFEQLITASDADSGDQFGRSLSLAGPYLVVGANGDDEIAPAAGAAYLFLREGPLWKEEGEIFATDPQAFDQLGLAQGVAVGGGTIAVGARQHTHDVTQDGSAWATTCGADYFRLGDCVPDLVKQVCQGITGPAKGACIQDQVSYCQSLLAGP